jgi:hypothetical protein
MFGLAMELKIFGHSLVAYGVQREIVKFKLMHPYLKENSKWSKIEKIWSLKIRGEV